MKLIESVRTRMRALKVADLAEMFGVSPQHVYKLAASGKIPSFRVSGTVRSIPAMLRLGYNRNRAGGLDPARRYARAA